MKLVKQFCILFMIGLALPNSAPAIIGGIPAQTEWPWMVGIISNEDPAASVYDSFACGGSLIHPQWVLTTASCIATFRDDGTFPPTIYADVFAGNADLNAAEDAYQRILIQEIIIHPGYDESTFDNDIALAHLTTSATGLTPIDIATAIAFETAGNTATITGWGGTGIGDPPSTLRQVTLPIIADNVCESAYPGNITANMFCAGTDGTVVKKDFCSDSGDAGGPLMVADSSSASQYVQVGLASWNHELGCGESYGVYTKLSKYIAWIAAQGVPLPVALAVQKSGTGAGVVTSDASHPGISCGADCGQSYTLGSVVTLTATPDSGMTFVGWSGGGCSGTGTCVLTLSDNTAPTVVTAAFNAPQYNLTVAKAGTGAGTVSSAPPGIDCGATCVAPFTVNTSVTLTAASDANSLFIGWSGGCAGATPTCALSITADTTVTAGFQLARTLTVTTNGAGTVTSDPVGITCGAGNTDCAEAYADDTFVTLTAAPSTGAIFTGWSGGGCAGTGRCVVPMTTDTAVTATFVPLRTLTVTPSGSGAGTVTSVPAGITCGAGGADCAEAYADGASVTLTAAAVIDSIFTGWSGGGCSGTGTCAVTMTADTTVTATFVKQYMLTVSAAGGSGTGSVSSSPAGITCGADCAEKYNTGTAVTLTATPNADMAFTGWSGGGCSGTGTCVVTITADTTVTATFVPQYTLTVAKSGTGAGTVSSSPAGITCGTDCTEKYNTGAAVTLTATAVPGSRFTGWSGGGCSGTGTCVVTVTAATTVTANFVPQYTLTVTKGGSGAGTVSSSPTGITCGADCTEAYDAGTVVTLTATAAAGSRFTGWSGACTNSTGTCSVTMSAAKTATANFVLQYTLTVTKTGSGTVTSSPSGIACGTDCAETYDTGTAVTLTATAASGSVFTGWSGACTNSTGTCSVTMSAAKSVAATFTPQYTLTVTKTGNGAGTVTSNPTGISCGADCSEIYNNNTVVTLTATPAAESTFSGWSGACANSTGTCSVTMSAAKSVTATFTLKQYSLTVTKAGTGGGTVTSSPTGIACGTDCAELYNSGAAVTLTAAAESGSAFSGWSGACAGTGACSVTMSAAKSVTATFTKLQYTLTAFKNGSGSGTITSSPAGISCGADCAEIYNAGAIVTLTATPAANSAFSGWSGNCFGMGTCAVTMNAAKNVTATFIAKYALTVTKAGAGSGTVTSSPAGISCGADCAELYVTGAVVTLTATPAAGARFDGWSGACSGAGACTLTMSAAKSVTATFSPTTAQLTVQTMGNGAGTVTSSPAGISCGADCAEIYQAGAVVTLTAQAATGSTFTGWVGGCAGTGACAVTMNAAQTVTAVFTKPVACAVRAVCNSSFEQGLARWSSVENAALTVGRTGLGLLVRNDGTNSDAYQFMKPNATLSKNVFPAGKWYQVTAWCKANVGTQCGIYLGDANTWYNPPDHQREARRYLGGTGDWQKISIEVYLDKPEILSVYLYAPTAGSAVAYDDVAIQPLAACPDRTICNGNFEQTYAFWGGTENANLTAGRSGMGLRITQDAANSDSYYRLSGVFPGGATYRVRAWCLADAGEECRLFFGDANTIYGAPYEHVGSQILPGNGQWQQLTATVTLMHDEVMGVNLYSKTTNGTVVYDDVTLEAMQPHVVWNKGTAGKAQVWTAHPTTGQTLETQTVSAAANWQAAHAQWYEDGTTTLLWRYTDGRGMVTLRAPDGATLAQRVYGPLSGWKAASYQRQGDGAATLLWMTGTGGAKLWQLDSAGTKVGELAFGTLKGWVAMNHQRHADGALSLLWRNTTNGRARVWMLNAQGQKMSEAVYGPLAGWIPVNYTRYADGTATLFWRNTTNGRGRVWRLNAGGQKVSEQTHIPATGWKAVAYLQAPQRYQANMITIWKTGTGTGAVTVGSSVCAASCGVMQIPVMTGVVQSVTATPTAGSVFAGWRNAQGQALTGLEYLRAGDEVFAVFNKQ